MASLRDLPRPQAPNDASFVFSDQFERWQDELHVSVVASTSSFQDTFDDDDTLMYDPEYTGAIILCE